jgi:hypothetical protein
MSEFIDTIRLDAILKSIEKIGFKKKFILNLMLNLKEQKQDFNYGEKIYLMEGLIEIYNNTEDE